MNMDVNDTLIDTNRKIELVLETGSQDNESVARQLAVSGRYDPLTLQRRTEDPGRASRDAFRLQRHLCSFGSTSKRSNR